MSGDLEPVEGVRIGHWTDHEAQTGCTVLLFDRPVLAAAEVRGAAPGTRELALLEPGRLVQHIDAFVLSGGSAFGLAAADGVMTWLRGNERGVPTAALPVPIVPAAVIFDLSTGKAAHPTAASGFAACEAAVPLAEASWGAVGAGTGATVAKIDGPGRPAGITAAQVALRDGSVTAVVVLNALGDLANLPLTDRMEHFLASTPPATVVGEQTTLIAVVIDAECDHDTLIRCCVAAHDGLARAIWPAHTLFDGDLALAVTLREGKRPPPARELRLTMATELAVEAALHRAATMVETPRNGR